MKRKIRVVIPTVYDPECPTIRSRLYPLCRILTDKGFNFVFLVLGEGTKEVYPEIICRGYRNYRELIKSILNIKQTETDIIFASKSYSVTGGLSYFVAKARKIGFVLDVDDRIFPSEINKWWRLPIYIQEWLVEKLLILLKPPTIAASRTLQSYYGKHVSYVPNSVNLEYFSKKRWSSGRIKKKYRISSSLVIWPAVFFQEIDRQYVLEIFKRIEQKGMDISLMILGDGEYLPAIRARARKMGLNKIIFVGKINYDQVPFYYASADAGIIPLRNNQYDACKGPIKLYEYMAMELPVIATPIGEPRDMVEKADCGVLIPFDDPGRASDIIIELFDSKEKLIRLGQNGRKYLETFQSLEKQAQTLEKIFRSLFERKDGGIQRCQ